MDISAAELRISERIEQKICARFSVQQFEIFDDSSEHRGHIESSDAAQTHLRIRVVSDAFAGLNRVQRHQRIYQLLATEFEDGLHALVIHAHTPEEAGLTG